jgi:hypothetical protein
LMTDRTQLSVLDNWIYYPPWIMGMTVTMSPSFTNDSLVSKSEESIPFTTIKELPLLKSVSYPDTDFPKKETISFIEAACFLRVREEHPNAFL